MYKLAKHFIYFPRAIKENLIAMEDNPATKHIEKFTLDTCARSPKYAEYRPGEVRVGSLGAGHANHGFAMLHDKRQCDIEAISENGYLSHDKCFKDAGIRNATLNGMTWKVLRWEVEAAFPSIPRIVQAALNTVTQIAEGYRGGDRLAVYIKSSWYAAHIVLVCR